jgi:hypothetical protein
MDVFFSDDICMQMPCHRDQRSKAKIGEGSGLSRSLLTSSQDTIKNKAEFFPKTTCCTASHAVRLPYVGIAANW